MTQETVNTRATVESIKVAVKRLPDALRRGPTAEAFMQRIGMVVLSRIRQAFITKSRGGTDDSGLRWAPLSPITIYMRSKKRGKKYSGGSVDILRDTGRLLNSLTPGMPGNVLRSEDGVLTIGTSVPYAAKHHEGIPGKLPQRRLWPEPANWPESWRQDIAEQVAQAIAIVAAQEIRETT